MDYEYSRETEKCVKEKTIIKETGTQYNRASDDSDGIIEIETTDQYLQLMEVYLSEWEHRDSSLWKQAFSYYLFTLAVIVFPYVTAWTFNDSIPITIPFKLFPIAGIG